MNSCMATVAVRLIDVPHALDKDYTYFAPENILRGSLVEVPFGRTDRPYAAVVLGECETPENVTPKCISRVLDYPVRLTEELLGLCGFVAERCLCTFGSVLKTVIPPGFNIKADEYVDAVSTDDLDAFKSISAQCEELYRFISAKGRCRVTQLPFEDVNKLLRQLGEHGLISRSFELARRINEKNEKYVRLSISAENAEMYLTGELKPPSEKAGRVIELLLQNPVVGASELSDYAACGPSVLKTLEKHGVIEFYSRRAERTSYIAGTERLPMPTLSHEQQKAFDEVSALMDSKKPKAALLYGVTGSGKTKVVLAAVKKALDSGRQAIVLVPEIGLAAQTAGIFLSHFGDNVAVIHSALSVGERLDAYRRIAEGRANIVVGTRSAVFAPCSNIGVIAVDEEQEHTYRSEMSPRYNAIEVAKYRCATHDSLLMLCSATPSVESFHRAENGFYTLIRLSERYGNAVLPEVSFSDLREDDTLAPDRMIGADLKREIAANLERGEQTILFLNRRGYNSAVICHRCGHSIECPNCSVPLSLHVTAHARILTCHYCGYTRPLDSTCPACSSAALGFVGYGTQRLEEELNELFPSAAKIRMDGDTTVVRGSHDEIYTRFKNREADILYGTQMITKGLDFPSVTLVGVILADASLYQSDFRACERTFSMLTQVIGRAGRAEKAGRAIIQTYSPSHRILELARRQDYDTFYREEILLRRAVLFPPFCDMGLIHISGQLEREVCEASGWIAERLLRLRETECPKEPMILFGPFNDPIYRLNGSFRKRLVIKFKSNTSTRRILANALEGFSSKYKKTYASADINPPMI